MNESEVIVSASPGVCVVVNVDDGAVGDLVVIVKSAFVCVCVC